MSVEDREGNRLLDSRDHFFADTPQGTLSLPPEQGLTLLNYYLDPHVLARRHLGVLVRRGSGPWPMASDELPSPSDPRLPSSFREALENPRLPFWEADGHLDLDILEGLRNYRPEENRPYSGLEGLGVYFNGPYAGRQLGITALVALGFMAGEHMTSPAFMWQTYTTNFLSMAVGSFDRHSQWISAIERAEGSSALPDLPPAERRRANLQAADARSQLARDRLYWVFMSPIVVGACLADPNFRAFLRSPSILPRYFFTHSRFALSSLARNPLGMGIATLAGFGIYEISSTWFDLYGGLRRGTAANQVFSGLSSLLVESVLLSRTSQELRALTGSGAGAPPGALSAANLRELFRLRPSLGVSIRIPEGSFLARLWSRSPRAQALFQRSFLPTVELSPEMGPTRFLNRFGLPRAALEARIGWERTLAQTAAVEARATIRGLTSESILSRAALGVSRSAIAEAEGAAAAEAILTVRRVRLAGLPILAAAGTAGLLIGAGYLTGYFNPRHTPRDLLRETLGF